MRITSGMTADNAVYNLNQGQNVLNTLQEQVSSGVVVNQPSDDPLTTRQLLSLQDQVNAGKQTTSNITKGTLALNVANTALGGMMDIMTQIKSAAATMLLAHFGLRTQSPRTLSSIAYAIAGAAAAIAYALTMKGLGLEDERLPTVAAMGLMTGFMYRVLAGAKAT